MIYLKKAFMKSLCTTRFPQNSVNLFFIGNNKEKVDEFLRELTFAKRLYMKTFGEIRMV